MPPRAILDLLDYKLRMEEEGTLWRIVVAEHLAGLVRVPAEHRMSFTELRKKIWNPVSTEKDTRTAEDIINDTLKKHKITLVEEPIHESV